MSKISPIKERIMKYLDYKGISKYEMYRNTKISNGAMDKLSGFTEESISRILATYPDISVKWLITGVGEMLENVPGNVSFDVSFSKSKKPQNAGQRISENEDVNNEVVTVLEIGKSKSKKQQNELENYCRLCQEKERLIGMQNNTIGALNKAIEQLEVRLKESKEKSG